MIEETQAAPGPSEAVEIRDEIQPVHAPGYAQELARRLGGFSSYAISLSIIGILSGGVTSFPLALSSVGGASIGLGWPLVACLALTTAATMGQLASKYPTAGGLYHWASILGGRGWGWTTAWFNLAGLITALAAINVGTYRFALQGLAPALGLSPEEWSPLFDQTVQLVGLGVITFAQAAINQVGVGLTARLTDFNGWWILVASSLLTVALLAFAPGWNFSRLVGFQNFSGEAGGNIWPRDESLLYLFTLGSLLPAYTITCFDASAHVSEETKDAAHNVPRGMVRSVIVSGIAGWIFLSAMVLAAPSLSDAAHQGNGSFLWILISVLPPLLAVAAIIGIIIPQYLCGLATLTSTSRMLFAFARDGGLPCSALLRKVNHSSRTPVAAIWAVALAAVLFTVYTPVYSTMTAVCTIFLYVSYVIPTSLGALRGGQAVAGAPWSLGPWYRPLAAVSVLGSLFLIGVGMQPPNQSAVFVVGGMSALLAVVWFGLERRRFPGPPLQMLSDIQRVVVEAGAEPPKSSIAGQGRGNRPGAA